MPRRSSQSSTAPYDGSKRWRRLRIRPFVRGWLSRSPQVAPPCANASVVRHGRPPEVKIALDPYMLRDRPFGEVCRIAADIGYDSIELSPRPDFIPFFTHPRADRDKVAEFRSALSETRMELASILPLYRWSSPDEDE